MALSTQTQPSAYELRRQEVEAELPAELKRRQEAITRQMAAQGLSDSGIQAGAQRSQDVALRMAAARRLGEIDVGEAQERTRLEEAQRERQFMGEQAQLGREFMTQERLGSQEFAGEQAELGRGLQREQMAMSQDLAQQGLDIQRTATALQARGMDQQNAQFYASMAQADKLANRGMDLQQMTIELQRQNLSQQDAQFYSAQAQAKELANRGFEMQDIAFDLQRQGMDAQTAQWAAQNEISRKQLEIVESGQQMEYDLFNKQITADITKAIIADTLGKLKPGTDAYNNFINRLSTELGVPDITPDITIEPTETSGGTGPATYATRAYTHAPTKFGIDIFRRLFGG